MQAVRLADICSPKQWKTIATKDLKQQGYLVYGANGVIGYNDTYNHEEPTLLITCRGATCGEINISEPKSYINGNAMCLDNLSRNCDIKYLFHTLKNYDFSRGVISGTAQPQITIERLKNVKISLPPLPEQQRIAVELDTVCNVLAKQKKQFELFGELVKSKFNEMFGDPVKNDKGWDVKRLAEACTAIGDGLHGTPKYSVDGDYYFINGSNLFDGKISVNNQTQKVDSIEYKKHRIDFCPNTIFISINGSLGKVAFYDNEQIVLGKSACYLNLKDNMNKQFVRRVFESNEFQLFLHGEATKSTIKNVSLKTMRNFLLILPPFPLQQQFADFVNQVEQSKAKLKAEIEQTETLYKALMQKYFGGGDEE